jgi:hypothetical protein
MSCAATLFVKDMRFVHPPFEHWVEINVAFYGIHAVILAMLFYFHQGVSGVESEGEQLSVDGDSIVFV